ncbi:hypothetical protein [Streptomyces sp. 135]|nr:hypothetical protein [Streptomyces sp. 135]
MGAYRSYAQELTAVGGAAVAANAISAVTVAPTLPQALKEQGGPPSSS